MPDHRSALLAISARLDQMQSDAEAVLAGPVYPDVGARTEELRKLLVEMQAMVEETLDQHVK